MSYANWYYLEPVLVSPILGYCDGACGAPVGICRAPVGIYRRRLYAPFGVLHGTDHGSTPLVNPSAGDDVRCGSAVLVTPSLGCTALHFIFWRFIMGFAKYFEDDQEIIYNYQYFRGSSFGCRDTEAPRRTVANVKHTEPERKSSRTWNNSKEVRR